MTTYTAMAWPIGLLIMLGIVGLWLRTDLRPIVTGVVTGIAAHAQKYAPAYGVAFLLGLAASLQALAEVGEKLGWVYAGAAAKVLQPGIVAVLGYIMRSPTAGQSNQPPKP